MLFRSDSKELDYKVLTKKMLKETKVGQEKLDELSEVLSEEGQTKLFLKILKSGKHNNFGDKHLDAYIQAQKENLQVEAAKKQEETSELERIKEEHEVVDKELIEETSWETYNTIINIVIILILSIVIGVLSTIFLGGTNYGYTAGLSCGLGCFIMLEIYIRRGRRG